MFKKSLALVVIKNGGGATLNLKIFPGEDPRTPLFSLRIFLSPTVATLHLFRYILELKFIILAASLFTHDRNEEIWLSHGGTFWIVPQEIRRQ